MTRSRNTVIALSALAAAISSAFAQEAPRATGTVSITGIYTDVRSDNAFRFEEYRDLEKAISEAK